MPNFESNKIYISGTGRSGTTFLMLIFTFLDLPTGFSKENFKKHISNSGCNSGLEKEYGFHEKIVKCPNIIIKIPQILKDPRIKIQQMIIPIRNYEESAKSRERFRKNGGGLWNASNAEEQLLFYHKIMSEYLCYMVEYDIPTIFIDFNKMVSDPTYLYNKLEPIWKEFPNVTFDLFTEAYKDASEHQKNKRK